MMPRGSYDEVRRWAFAAEIVAKHGPYELTAEIAEVLKVRSALDGRSVTAFADRTQGCELRPRFVVHTSVIRSLPAPDRESPTRIRTSRN